MFISVGFWAGTSWCKKSFHLSFFEMDCQIIISNNMFFCQLKNWRTFCSDYRLFLFYHEIHSAAVCSLFVCDCYFYTVAMCPHILRKEQFLNINLTMKAYHDSLSFLISIYRNEWKRTIMFWKVFVYNLIITHFIKINVI